MRSKQPRKHGSRETIGHLLYAEYSLALPKRAEFVRKQLSKMNRAFEMLFSDENFVTLLRAEGMASIPVCLKDVAEKARNRA